MSTLDPPAGPADQTLTSRQRTGHPMSALPDAQDTQFDEEKKQFASADVATGGSNSDVEKGSQHGTVANDTDLMAPPSGPPYGEPEKPNSRYSLAEIYKHKWAKVLVDVFCVAVILGWWIAGLLIKRHDYWIQNTILAWFFIGLFFFKYVPTSIFSRPIGKAWRTCVSAPFFKLPYYARLGLGWFVLLGLVFGSAYGFSPTTGGSNRAIRTQAVFGLAVVVFVFWATSRDRKNIKWQPVIVGLALQQALAMFVLKTLAGFDLFRWIAIAATDLLNQSNAGVTFFVREEIASQGLFFFSTLGAIVFFIALVQLLFYIGVLQWMIKKFAWLFFRAMGVSGAEAVVAAASPFIGQGESACMIKPYVAYLTPAEIHQSMTSGFSTIAGSVFLAYVNLGVDPVTLITASVMSIPASLAISKLRYPEEHEPLTSGRLIVARDNDNASNALHAFSNGAWFGLRVAGLILANVLTVLSLLSLINGLLTYIGNFWHIENLTLEFIFGYVLFPVAWLMGVEGREEILKVSQILALKVIANEFVAYQQLQAMAAAGNIGERALTIASYAVCGFGNIASLGITIGVFSGLAPNQKSVIARLGPSALICGICSTCMSAAIAGMLI